MTFSDTVRFLYSLGHELKVVKWDLERMRTLLGALGDPHRRGRFVHVAGTNGKGSVCAMLEAGLRANGLRTGLYTSPHLMSPRERICIAGEMISEAAWVGTFEETHDAAERLLAAETIDAHPSFFETVTAMAFLALARAGVEITVLETGLGGRLDATNVVEQPEVAVITPIDFDHEAFLGSAIESIAAEKAGILKAGRPAVFAAQRPEALRVLENRALELAIEVRHSSAWRVEGLVCDRNGSRFTLVADEEIPIECPLAGKHQVENARTAAATLALMGVPAEAIRAGIATVRWPGRLERVEAAGIILDGAHNPAGARALAEYIGEFFAGEPVRIIFGAMRDKAVEEVTNTLFPLAAEIILTAPKQPRALNPAALAEVADDARVRVADSVGAALEMALQADKQRPMTTFVTGSLFLVGEAREWLRV